jgi:hypothetical protein
MDALCLLGLTTGFRQEMATARVIESLPNAFYDTRARTSSRKYTIGKSL